MDLPPLAHILAVRDKLSDEMADMDFGEIDLDFTVHAAFEDDAYGEKFDPAYRNTKYLVNKKPYTNYIIRYNISNAKAELFEMPNAPIYRFSHAGYAFLSDQ